jgi:hypothetical protein
MDDIDGPDAVHHHFGAQMDLSDGPKSNYSGAGADGSSSYHGHHAMPPRPRGINPYPLTRPNSTAPLDPARVQEELAFLRQDLMHTLNLTAHQQASIKQLAFGQQKELLACHAFSRLAGTLAANAWMDFPAVEAVQDGFRSFLLANQLELFYKWSKRNLSAIESLDIKALGESAP